MINRKYKKFVSAFFMSFLMSFIMSLVISLFNVGLVGNIIEIWLSAWGFSCLIAFPAILMVQPFADKLTDLVLSRDTDCG